MPVSFLSARSRSVCALTHSAPWEEVFAAMHDDAAQA